MSGSSLIGDLDALVARIGDGAMVALPPSYSGVAMEATRCLIRRGVRNLHIVTVPASGLQADLLIGAGCVATVETAAITLDEFGLAPRFTAAVRAGAVALRDATCPAIHAALQASEKGVPFLPLRGLIGTDILANRPDWKVVDNPFGENDPIVLLPAVRPDVALFHARWVDRDGNVWIGNRRELMTMAHASRESLVTVEEIYDGDLLADATLAAGTIPALYVGAVAVAPRGAWPLRFEDRYPADIDELQTYVRMARSTEGFTAFMAGERKAAERAGRNAA
jgi:glutaconate CoA-transferase subunit A